MWYVNYRSCRSKDKIKYRQVMSENIWKQGWVWQFSKVAAKLWVMENWKKLSKRSWKVMEFEELKRVWGLANGSIKHFLCTTWFAFANYSYYFTSKSIINFSWREDVRSHSVPSHTLAKLNWDYRTLGWGKRSWLHKEVHLRTCKKIC